MPATRLGVDPDLPSDLGGEVPEQVACRCGRSRRPRAAGSNPRPSSVDGQADRRPASARGRPRRRPAPGVLERVAHRLLGDPEAERLALDVEVDAGLDLERGLDPARVERREHVLERRLEAGPLQARRVDLDEQAAQRADAGRGSGAAPARSARRRVGIAALDPACADLEREGDAGQVLHGAVVEIAGDPAALAIGGVDRALEQPDAGRGGRCGRAGPATSPAAAGSSSSRSSATISAGRNASQRSRPLEVTSPYSLVGLEQQRLPVGAADPRVGLEQLPEVALVLVLGLGEVAQLGVRGAVGGAPAARRRRGRTAGRSAAARPSRRSGRPRPRA